MSGTGTDPSNADVAPDRTAEWDDLRRRHIHPTGERPESSARGVHHVALLCHDVETTIEFYQGLLEFPFGVVEECVHEARPAAEPAEHCALAHTGLAGDRVHRDGVDAALRDQQRSRVEQTTPITCGVSAFRGIDPDLGQQGTGHASHPTVTGT